MRRGRRSLLSRSPRSQLIIDFWGEGERQPGSGEGAKGGTTPFKRHKQFKASAFKQTVSKSVFLDASWEICSTLKCRNFNSNNNFFDQNYSV